MRKVFVAACALGAVAGFVPASASEPETIGTLCGFTSVPVPRSHDFNVGEIDGGPLVVVDTDGTPLTATLTCAIHLQTNPRYSDPALVAATSPATTGVVMLPPTPFSFVLPSEEVRASALCTQLDVAGYPSMYYGSDGEWSTDPASTCLFAAGTGGPEFGSALRFFACPVLAVVLPPEGDGLIFDCPPT